MSLATLLRRFSLPTRASSCVHLALAFWVSVRSSSASSASSSRTSCPPFFAQLDFCQAAFVVNLHRGAVFHGLGDVVHIDIIAEHRRRIDVFGFNRRAGKTQVGGVGQRIAQIFGEAIDRSSCRSLARSRPSRRWFCAETVLGAVGFVGNDHDVLALGQRFVDVALFGLELLDGGKDHAPGSNFEQGFEMLAAFGLDRVLAQELPGSRRRCRKVGHPDRCGR